MEIGAVIDNVEVLTRSGGYVDPLLAKGTGFQQACFSRISLFLRHECLNDGGQKCTRVGRQAAMTIVQDMHLYRGKLERVPMTHITKIEQFRAYLEDCHLTVCGHVRRLVMDQLEQEGREARKIAAALNDVEMEDERVMPETLGLMEAKTVAGSVASSSKDRPAIAAAPADADEMLGELVATDSAPARTPRPAAKVGRPKSGAKPGGPAKRRRKAGGSGGKAAAEEEEDEW